MIFIDAGRRSDRSFEARLLLAAQLRSIGLDVGIDESTLPDNLHRNHKYDSAMFVVSRDDVPLDGVIVLTTETVADPTLSTLRAYGLCPDKPVVVIGRFETKQQRIGVQSRIAYATSSEPLVVDLADIQPAPILQGALTPIFGDMTTTCSSAAQSRVLVFLPDKTFHDETASHALAILATTSKGSISIICSAKGKSKLLASKPEKIRVFTYAELMPDTLANQTDIAVVLGATSPGDRIGQLCASLIATGGIVIDATEAGCLSQSRAPIVRGPIALLQLPSFLEREIYPNLDAIRAEVMASAWRQENSIAHLIAALPDTFSRAATQESKTFASKTFFLPTNGVGLGHAQRCSLIASEMEAGEPIFAAFPSCIEMLERHGFPCRPLIQKSEAHDDPFANDIVNYRRLKRWLSSGDQLVFDGVYIFDSVYRSILEHDLDAVWIRRGLWQPHQSNTKSLDREHVFNRVIVPDEAFDELNQHYSYGAHIHHVGPIVQLPNKKVMSVRDARKRIARQIGRDFETLVVSMLGGGVAASRGPQLQTICASLEDRTDVLHLIVVWPNAKVAPELALWQNTHIVRSLDALSVARAADTLVSAVGYNSFHEILYHQIPSILIPQIAPYMDDQERRAQSAVDRGLAEMVLPEDLLLLERKLTGFLDRDFATRLRSRLAKVTLPTPGNTQAAQIVEGTYFNV